MTTPFLTARHVFRRPARTASRAFRLAAFAALSVLATATLPAAADDGDTLRTVRARGALVCGVNTALPGFAVADSLGRWTGLDVDVCRAIASAIFGDPEAVRFEPTTSLNRFDRLVAGRFDVLSRNTTWTAERDGVFGAFAGVNFYDGQGFMVPKASGVRSALELDARRVCVARGTTSEQNAADYFDATEMRYRPVEFPDEAEAAAGYAAGRCDALTSDRSGLAGIRSALANPDAHRVLFETISKEPLGPVVRAGDDNWLDVVRWSLACMINAEELGISRSGLLSGDVPDHAAARRLLGLEGEAGPGFGLEPSWCADIVRFVGNYGDSYERHVGLDTPLALERGLNALWTDGGLLYAPPIR